MFEGHIEIVYPGLAISVPVAYIFDHRIAQRICARILEDSGYCGPTSSGARGRVVQNPDRFAVRLQMCH
jgi:hypothetical protein